MSMICFYCAEPVYTAETKTYDGKTFHHGVCFGIWKKELDRELADSRNAEYYKTPDVSTTKVKEPNYNTVIYATQYDPTGTQPNATYSSAPSPKAADSSDTVTALPVFPVVARQRASSFSRRPYSGTFVPRPTSGTFMHSSSGTWTQADSQTFPRSSSSGTISRERSGTETRTTTMTSSGTMTKSPSQSNMSGSSGSWIPTTKRTGDTFTTTSNPSSPWIPTKRSSDSFKTTYSSRGSGTITS